MDLSEDEETVARVGAVSKEKLGQHAESKLPVAQVRFEVRFEVFGGTAQ